MPGPVPHHFTARAVARSLVNAGTVPASFLTEHAAFLHLGSQGPDFLFFNARDWGVSGAPEAVNTFLSVYETVERIKRILLDALAPAIDFIHDVDETLSDESTIYNQVRELLGAVSGNMALAEALIRTGIENALLNLAAPTLFNNVVTHPEQRVNATYQDKQNWWWFDLMHYKRTGQFTQTLLRRAAASGSEQQRAYALGYLTHFAADTVGHPYINILSAGPYRTHSQRHKVIENYHDATLYRHYVPGGEFVQSRLFEQYILSGDAISPRMPDDLANTISASMQDVFHRGRGTPFFGQIPTARDLQNAYELWLLWFRRATTVFENLRPPEPYSLTEELEEALRRFEEELSEIADSLSRPTRGGFDVRAFFEMIAAAIAALFKFFVALLDFIIGSAIAIATSVLRALLAVLYEAGYNLLMNFYEGIALTGLAFPFHRMTVSERARHFFNPAIRDTLGRNAAAIAADQYPTKRFWISDESHLSYPHVMPGSAGLTEQAVSNRGPAEYMTNPPLYYLEMAGKTVPDAYNFLRLMDSNRLSDLAGQVFTHNFTLGSAREFSLFLYDKVFTEGQNLPDFNLDGDRGYGFKCWRLRESTRELPGTEDDFPDIQQIEENPDHHVPNSLVNII